MTRFAALALGIVVTSAGALAEPDPVLPRFRASFSYGAAIRSVEHVFPGTVPLYIDGLSPSVFHGAGTFFFSRYFGVAVDGSVESFRIVGANLANIGIIGQLSGFRLLGEAVGRLAPARWLGFQLHLGLAGGQWPSVAVQNSDVVARPVGWLGLSAGLTVSVEPELPVGGLLWARVHPAFVSSASAGASSVSAGVQLWGGNFGIGELRLSPMLEGEVLAAGGQVSEPGAADYTKYRNVQLRAALGLRVHHRAADPVTGGSETTTATKAGPGRIRGRVVTGGVGLSGAEITAAQLPATTSGADGAFTLEAVAPGTYTLKAVLAGYKPVELPVTVQPGDEAVVTFLLTRPTGPGQLRGVVKGEKGGPLDGAEVVAEGRAGVKTAADGAYAIEQVGPGPVKVTVTAKGYQPAEEAAQVPAEGTATLDFTLVKLGAAVPATIRGSVRAASGKVVKATVKVSSVNLTIPIKGDGRFVVQVPGGKYTLTIEAPGYVSQTKTVEVADGDQAIFHCDLQPQAR